MGCDVRSRDTTVSRVVFGVWKDLADSESRDRAVDLSHFSEGRKKVSRGLRKKRKGVQGFEHEVRRRRANARHEIQKVERLLTG
jgi:hypothetical protein